MVDLAGKAMSGQLAIEDQIGGTFTLSNGNFFLAKKFHRRCLWVDEQCTYYQFWANRDYGDA